MAALTVFGSDTYSAVGLLEFIGSKLNDKNDIDGDFAIGLLGG